MTAKPHLWKKSFQTAAAVACRVAARAPHLTGARRPRRCASATWKAALDSWISGEHHLPLRKSAEHAPLHESSHAALRLPSAPSRAQPARMVSRSLRKKGAARSCCSLVSASPTSIHPTGPPTRRCSAATPAPYSALIPLLPNVLTP
eukprot:TRINITY_DN655_c0_g1_i7.p3 TRINITY_DN655_c0_g1~~TRINITY_DN655_c0_g1_i7.p3  ORF type:complete len:147 (+),score=22.71 TRINITY_DN655_c0_g1_i7:544-984(+)